MEQSPNHQKQQTPVFLFKIIHLLRVSVVWFLEKNINAGKLHFIGYSRNRFITANRFVTPVLGTICVILRVCLFFTSWLMMSHQLFCFWVWTGLVSVSYFRLNPLLAVNKDLHAFIWIHFALFYSYFGDSRDYSTGDPKGLRWAGCFTPPPALSVMGNVEKINKERRVRDERCYPGIMAEQH